MFINDRADKNNVRQNVADYLLGLVKRKIENEKAEGIMPTVKLWKSNKFKFEEKNERRTKKRHKTKAFNTSLKRIQTENVTLTTGQTVSVPKFVPELCEFILQNVETTGIFRLAGSCFKQQKIKLRLDEGGRLSDEDQLNVIDVASVLKLFLRELPEPLVPEQCHKLFLACWSLENQEEAILFATLVLPTENLNLLIYLMQFFKKVASFSSHNKMDSYNISVCITPNIFPAQQLSGDQLFDSIEITKFLIEKSSDIGVITNKMQQQLEFEKKVGENKNNFLITVLKYLKRIICNC
ncbi:hypothetical protein NQ314_005260 [Rhamnusium bicolor]|uniref:Rho-GAP domain-containing protein n=1 Tax=Rhamnusium bicolor TaxID=1586634 RepID=A0AAV8ZK89_9CUCU|nr:hypothetical protein NQ314_005260 [Rhamnusium bicolor]